MIAPDWHTDHTTPEYADWQAARMQQWLDTHAPATDHDRRIVEGPVTGEDEARVALMRADRP